jgi:hypothetical protein
MLLHGLYCSMLYVAACSKLLHALCCSMIFAAAFVMPLNA